MEDRYSVLIRFDSQNSTDNFYKHFSGKRFSSLEVCFLLTLVNRHTRFWHSISTEKDADILDGKFCSYELFLNFAEGRGLPSAFYNRRAVHRFNRTCTGFSCKLN